MGSNRINFNGIKSNQIKSKGGLHLHGAVEDFACLFHAAPRTLRARVRRPHEQVALRAKQHGKGNPTKSPAEK